MLISFGYDISLRLKWKPQFFFALGSIRPAGKTLSPARIFESSRKALSYNIWTDFETSAAVSIANRALFALSNQGVIQDSGQLDAYEPSAPQDEIFNLRMWA